MNYNHQNIPNRLKRGLWALIVCLKYIFRKKSYENNNIICKIVCEMDYSVPCEFKNNKEYRDYRYETGKIGYGKIYYVYFYKEFKEEVINGDFYAVEFPNSFSGIKLFFEYIYKLNPSHLLIHDALVNFFQDYIVSKILPSKILFFPRGMNYYGDYVFRDKSSILKFLRAIFNKFAYKYWLKKSVLVNAPSVFSLECELVSFREVHTSDFLLLQGACSLLYTDYLDNELSVKFSFIDEYDCKLFTFSRVEKGKFIDDAIKSFLSVKDKINKSSCIIIIGDGSYLSTLKNRYKGHEYVIFLGHLDKSEAYPLIEKLDLFINPNGGYSLIETGFLGVPSVSYNVDIMSCIVYNRVNGYLVDKSSKEELDTAIIQHCNKSKEQIDEFKELTKRTFRMRFSKEALEQDRLMLTNAIFKDK